MEPGLDLANPIDVDDGRSTHAEKLARIELTLQAGHRFPDRVAGLAHVNLDVLAIRFEPIDVRDRLKQRAVAPADGDPLWVAVPRAEILQQSQYPRELLAVLALPELATSPRQRAIDPLLVERLEQVIECVDLESAQRV